MILRLTVSVKFRLVTDGQTDGQTHDDRVYHASMASRIKNWLGIHEEMEEMMNG